MANPSNKGDKISTRRRIGKAQARDQLPTLVNAVAKGSGAIEITEYGRVVAMLIDPKEYAWLLAKSQIEPTIKLRLCGSAVLLGDLADLEDASEQISNSITASINKTASEL